MQDGLEVLKGKLEKGEIEDWKKLNNLKKKVAHYFCLRIIASFKKRLLNVCKKED